MNPCIEDSRASFAEFKSENTIRLSPPPPAHNGETEISSPCAMASTSLTSKVMSSHPQGDSYRSSNANTEKSLKSPPTWKPTGSSTSATSNQQQNKQRVVLAAIEPNIQASPHRQKVKKEMIQKNDNKKSFIKDEVSKFAVHQDKVSSNSAGASSAAAAPELLQEKKSFPKDEVSKFAVHQVKHSPRISAAAPVLQQEEQDKIFSDADYENEDDDDDYIEYVTNGSSTRADAPVALQQKEQDEIDSDADYENDDDEDYCEEYAPKASSGTASRVLFQQKEQDEVYSDADYENEDDGDYCTRGDRKKSATGSDMAHQLSPELKELAELIEIQEPKNSVTVTKEEWKYVEAHASNELAALIDTKRNYLTFTADPVRLVVGRKPHTVTLFREYRSELQCDMRQGETMDEDEEDDVIADDDDGINDDDDDDDDATVEFGAPTDDDTKNDDDGDGEEILSSEIKELAELIERQYPGVENVTRKHMEDIEAHHASDELVALIQSKKHFPTFKREPLRLLVGWQPQARNLFRDLRTEIQRNMKEDDDHYEDNDDMVLCPELREFAELLERHFPGLKKVSTYHVERIEAHASNKLAALIRSKKSLSSYKTEPLNRVVGRQPQTRGLFDELRIEIQRNMRQDDDHYEVCDVKSEKVLPPELKELAKLIERHLPEITTVTKDHMEIIEAHASTKLAALIRSKKSLSSFIKEPLRRVVGSQPHMRNLFYQYRRELQHNIKQGDMEEDDDGDENYEDFDNDDSVPAFESLKKSSCGGGAVLTPGAKELAEIIERHYPGTALMTNVVSKELLESIATHHASNELAALIQSKKHYASFKTSPLRLLVGQDLPTMKLFREYRMELQCNIRGTEDHQEDESIVERTSDKSSSSAKENLASDVVFSSQDSNMHDTKRNDSSSKKRTVSTVDGSIKKRGKTKRRRESTKASRRALARGPASDIKILRRCTKALVREMAISVAAATNSGQIPLKYMELNASATLKLYMEFREDQSPNQYMLAPITTLVPEQWKDEFDDIVDQYTTKFRSEGDDHDNDSYAAETGLPCKSNHNSVAEAAPSTKVVVDTAPTKRKVVVKKCQTATTTTTTTEEESMHRAFILERKRRVKDFAENMRAELRDFEEQECNLWDSFLKMQGSA